MSMFHCDFCDEPHDSDYDGFNVVLDEEGNKIEIGDDCVFDFYDYLEDMGLDNPNETD